MPTSQLVPAAQYLRMSTEHQQYSLENQSMAIRKYAESYGFNVVRTYSDAARSGLILRHRTGLQELLGEVVSGTALYQAILVYDVSRWGRFQDTDESAHYEFLCKSAGVPVHYCAETFSNDGTLPNLIMKALKRTMAGEFSRELGTKVLAGQRRLARLGFKQGRIPGYGLRRMLVSSTGVRKQELASGERKSIATDRVILVPGPAHEVEWVRNMFRMVLSGKTVSSIASELDRRGVAYRTGSRWDYAAVYNILTQPKYAGCHVFGRTTAKLYTPVVRLPRSEWIVTPGAFEPIVDPAVFEEAQKILDRRTNRKTDDELLDGLRALYAAHGKLSLKLIQKTALMASASTYRYRFGGLRQAYERVGYGHPNHFGDFELRRRIKALRDELFRQIAALFPKDVSVITRGAKWRSFLRLSNGGTVSVLISRSMRTRRGVLRWRIDPIRNERRSVTLLARLNEGNQTFQDFYVFPHIDKQKRFHVFLSDPWLKRGKKLRELPCFCNVVGRLGAVR